MKNIAAIVVTYYPNEALLVRLLSSIRESVNSIIIVDNTPSDCGFWLRESWFFANQFDVLYKPLGRNCGLGRAQNVGLKFAIDNKYDHVILFDQDSAALPCMIDDLIKAEIHLINKGVRVGAVGPLFLDEKTNSLSKVIRYGFFFRERVSVNLESTEPVRADILIASGSLIRVNVLSEIGLMREDFFVDAIDVEWVLRAAYFGYMSFVIPSAVMLHSIGDDFFSIGKYRFNLPNDLRKYYSMRNYSNLTLDSKMGLKFRVNTLLKMPVYILFYTLASPHKTKAAKMMLMGCWHGYLGKLGQLIK